VSPDGTRALVEIGPGGGGNADIWLLGFEDDSISRLTFDEESSSPLWMPDGRRFVWVSTIEGVEVFRSRSIDGADPVRDIARVHGVITVADVTPDGRDVLFNEYGAVDADIWSLSIEGEEEPRLEVGGPLGQSAGVVSPDGRWIAYVSDDAGEREVYARPWRRSGSRSQISRNGGHLPQWAPDGESLFFVSHGAMYRVPVTPQGEVLRAGAPERLFDVEANTDSSYRDVAVHPSGSKFLVRLGSGVNERREIGITPGWAGTLAAP
jgi:Tol biopolymer transport system component